MFIRLLAIGIACIFIASTPIWSAQKANANVSGDWALRNPITGIADCCASEEIPAASKVRHTRSS